MIIFAAYDEVYTRRRFVLRRLVRTELDEVLLREDLLLEFILIDVDGGKTIELFELLSSLLFCSLTSSRSCSFFTLSDIIEQSQRSI